MYLVYLLAPLLQATPNSRLVMVSARAIDWVRKIPAWETDNTEASKYSLSNAYANSKLANITFANVMQKRLGDGVFVNSVDPGPVATNILTKVQNPWISTVLGFVVSMVGKNARDGAINQLYCSAATEIETLNVHATYFVSAQGCEIFHKRLSFLSSSSAEQPLLTKCDSFL